MTFPSAPLNPIYNDAILYKTGFSYVQASNTTITVNSGVCRDSSDSYDINVGDFFNTQVTTTVTIAANGLNGLDTGTVAASTVYALYAIADQAGYNPAGFLLSTNITNTPVFPVTTYPSNYNVIRRIGWVFTDASSHIRVVYLTGGSNTTEYWFDTPIEVLTAGTSATQAAVSLASVIPAVTNARVQLGCSFTNNAASDTAKICPSGGTIANSHALITGQVAGVVVSTVMSIPSALISGVPKFDYILSTASASLSVWVQGFTELL